MARKDPDYFVETKTVKELQYRLNQVKDWQQPFFGFHLSGDNDTIEWFKFLNASLLPKTNFPLQIMSGPALSLKYWNSFPMELQSLIFTEKVKLVVHLPFILSFYKQPETLKYQIKALQEYSDYLKTLGVWDDVSVLAHCGHPIYSTENQDTDLFKEWFVANVNDAASLFSVFLIENLAGYKGQKEPDSSVQWLYNSYFNPKLLDGNVFLAVDTEHHFAGGFNLNDIPKGAWDCIRFCHLNTNPYNVFKGSFVDLHSYTSIEEATARGNSVFNESNSTLQDWVVTLEHYKIPSVFERKVMSVQIVDIDSCINNLTYKRGA